MLRGKTITIATGLSFLLNSAVWAAGQFDGHGAFVPPQQAPEAALDPAIEQMQAAALSEFRKFFHDPNQGAAVEGTIPIRALQGHDARAYKNAAIYLMGDDTRGGFERADLMAVDFDLREALIRHSEKTKGAPDETSRMLVQAIKRAAAELHITDPRLKAEQGSDGTLPTEWNALKAELEKEKKSQAEEIKNRKLTPEEAKKSEEANHLFTVLFAADQALITKIEEGLRTVENPTEMDRVNQQILAKWDKIALAARLLLGDDSLKVTDGEALAAATHLLEKRLLSEDLGPELNAKLRVAIERGIAFQEKPEIVLRPENETPSTFSKAGRAIDNISGVLSDVGGKAKDALLGLLGYGEKKDPIEVPTPGTAAEEAGKILNNLADAARKPFEVPLPEVTAADKRAGRNAVDQILELTRTPRLQGPISMNELPIAPETERPKSSRLPKAETHTQEREPARSTSPASSTKSPLPGSPLTQPIDSELTKRLAQIGTVQPSNGKGSGGGYGPQGTKSGASSLVQPVAPSAERFPASSASSNSMAQVFNSSTTLPEAKTAAVASPEMPFSASEEEPKVPASGPTPAASPAGRPNPRTGGTNTYVYASAPTAIPAATTTGQAPGAVTSESALPDAMSTGASVLGEMPGKTAGSNVRSIGRKTNPNTVKFDDMYGSANGGGVSASTTVDNSESAPSIAERPSEETARPATARTIYGSNSGSAARDTWARPSQSQVAEASSILDPYIEKAKEWMGMDEAETEESQRSLASIDNSSPALRAAANAVSEILKDNFGIAYNAPSKFAPKEKPKTSASTNAKTAIKTLLPGGSTDLTSFLKASPNP